jgi:7-cyano-7-deazaguanine tRNA-ribosyltransferase
VKAKVTQLASAAVSVDNKLLIVAGISIKNLAPRVWDSTSEFHLPELGAIMVSYGEFHQLPSRRRAAMKVGLRSFLGVPDHVRVFLDNGAFYFGANDVEASLDEYEEFVEGAKPDWKPIPRDYIPFPSMSHQQRTGCMKKTMRVNLRYQHNGYVPVVHIGTQLEQYADQIASDKNLSKKPSLALGAIVPNLLRKPKALPYSDVLAGLQHVRQKFKDKELHVFGVGGTATIHLSALLGFDSVDSSGWRNRAARGIIQMPGSGERLVANLGSWRGRKPSDTEWNQLKRCRCPACQMHGVAGLKASKLHGFSCRAAHNLWVLLDENRWLTKHLAAGSYAANYKRRIDNSVYTPIIRELLTLMRGESA